MFVIQPLLSSLLSWTVVCVGYTAIGLALLAQKLSDMRKQVDSWQ